jgi:hypothetical protein
MVGIRIGIGVIASSASYYNQLSVEQTNHIEQVARTTVAFQDQLNFLESVILQNGRLLDLLNAKKGDCLFLNEECCF